MTDFSGGTQGLTGYGGSFRQLSPFDNGRFYDFFGVRFLGQDLWSICVGWTVVGLSLILVFLLVRSPWGRVLKAIREDEDAVRSLGKNVFVYKMQALVLGGVFGAVGGIVFALATQSLTPDFYFTAADLLRLRSAHHRRRRSGVRAGHRLDDFLVRALDHGQFPAPGHRWQ